eukprot:gene2400-2967_t
MSAPVLYSDLTKLPSDFIKKDFVDFNQVEINKKFSNTLSAIVTGSLKKDGFLLSVNPKVNLKDFINKTSNLSITVDTNKVGKVETTVENLVPGLKTILTANTNKLYQTELQYKKDRFAVTLVGNLDKKLIGSLVVAQNKFNFGVTSEYNAQKATLTNVDATVSYRPSADIFLALTEKVIENVLVAQFYDRVSPKVSLAGDVNFDIKATELKSFNLGAKYDLDSETSVKVKVNNQSKIAVGFQARYTPFLKGTLGWNIDAKDIKNNASHNFGISLKFEF